MALLDIDPKELVSVRNATHRACQFVTRSARANLVALQDDSHSNFGWDEKRTALVSHEIQEGTQVGFSFESASLLWLQDGNVSDDLPVSGLSDAEVQVWLDQRLEDSGLHPTGIAQMPYDLGGEGVYDFSRMSHLNRKASEQCR